jgi:hypothetical protein
MRIDQWNAVTEAGKLCDGIACDPKVYNRTNPNTAQWRRFILRHRAQVMEVLTKYGEICEASFDMNFPAQFDEDITDTFMLARELAPNTLFRGRGMGGDKADGGYGDYDTPEEEFPDKPIPGNFQGRNTTHSTVFAAQYNAGCPFLYCHLLPPSLPPSLPLSIFLCSHLSRQQLYELRP